MVKPSTRGTKVVCLSQQSRLRLWIYPVPAFSGTNALCPVVQVNETTFVRAMNASGIDLTKEELGLLIKRYRIPAGNGLIDYQKFCDQSNKVRNRKDSTAPTDQ